jgi:hypothetical protein
LNFAGFIFIAYVDKKKKMRWPLGGNFELPTWFITARATTFYDPVYNVPDKEAQCAWKEGEGSHWPSVYIQKPFMTL